MLGWVQKLRRQAAVAGANFAAMFADVDSFTPLPAGVTRLLEELDHPEPDLGAVQRLLEGLPAVAARVLRLVNSSLLALPQPVTDLRQACVVLGLRRLRELTVPCLVLDHLPDPGGLFDHTAFWNDGVFKAALARELVQLRDHEQAGTAFTGALLSELAVPVLLDDWGDYYAHVLVTAGREGLRLSDVERAQLGWDHAEAGAWLARSWGFPAELVTLIGLHATDPAQLGAGDLADTPAREVALVSLLPIAPDPRTADACAFAVAASRELGLDSAELRSRLAAATSACAELRELMGITGDRTAPVRERLLAVVERLEHRA